MTLLVQATGSPSRDVVTAESTIDDDALLVLRGEARPFAALAAGRAGRHAHPRGMGRRSRSLEGLKVAHQQIDPETVAVLDGGVGFVDFGTATVAPAARQLAGRPRSAAPTTAALVRKRACARGGVGGAGPRGCRRAPALPAVRCAPDLAAAGARGSRDRRRRTAGRGGGAVGAAVPELAKLRRVSVRALVQVALFGFAAYTIVEAAGGVDWGDVRSTVQDASWAWIVFAFVVAQLPRLSQAVSTLGSVPSSMPFGPVYAMQLATGYMNVALPSNLARMAVNIRFFQRQGLTAPTAVASGVIDSFAGTIVQGVLLGILLIFSESSLPWTCPSLRRLPGLALHPRRRPRRLRPRPRARPPYSQRDRRARQALVAGRQRIARSRCARPTSWRCSCSAALRRSCSSRPRSASSRVPSAPTST